MFKKNIKLFIGIIIGAVVFGSIGAYAASKIYASSVSVDTTNMSALGASSNVDAALTYLYGRASSIGAPSGVNMTDETIYYFGSNLSDITNISTNYMDLVNAGKTYFLMQNSYSQAACLYYNNELHCFRADRPVMEMRHAQSIFGTSACSNSGLFRCTGTDFYYIHISSLDYSSIALGTSDRNNCNVRDSGYFTCT